MTNLAKFIKETTPLEIKIAWEGIKAKHNLVPDENDTNTFMMDQLVTYMVNDEVIHHQNQIKELTNAGQR